LSLKDRIVAKSRIKATSVLADSDVFGQSNIYPTPVPMINTALAGEVDGGISSGILTIAGPSRHFKTAFALLMAASFLAREPDGVILFYDSEFGAGEDYFKAFGIPSTSVVHTPITNIEELKFDIMGQLSEMSRTDKVMILIDSIGNLASVKESKDALEGNSAADMTRAKELKSLARLITPHLTLKDIPLVAIAHTYQTLEMYSKTVVSGGTGWFLASDNIWVIGRQQEKDKAKELTGYNFDIKIEKSRHVVEGSKIGISVDFNGGINRWSGLLEVAEEGKFVVGANKGNRGRLYQEFDKETGELTGPEMKTADLETDAAFWTKMLKRQDFRDYIKGSYKLALGDIIQDKTEIDLE
jgi:hypothetical protein